MTLSPRDCPGNCIMHPSWLEYLLLVVSSLLQHATGSAEHQPASPQGLLEQAEDVLDLQA